MAEKTCYNCGTPITKEYCEDNYPNVCEHWSYKKPITTADRIRSMSDEELAEWIINGVSSDPCDYCKHINAHCLGTLCMGKTPEEIIIEWLQQPAKGGVNENE